MHRFDEYSSTSYSRGIRWLPSPEVCRMVLETRKFVMAIIHWKQGLLCDKSLIVICLTFTTQSRILMTLKKKPFENTVGKQEKMLVTSIFSFFHNVFYPSQNKCQIFTHVYFGRLQILSISTSLKILSLGKGLVF